jgi:hypothetical protein
VAGIQVAWPGWLSVCPHSHSTAGDLMLPTVRRPWRENAGWSYGRQVATSLVEAPGQFPYGSALMLLKTQSTE